MSKFHLSNNMFKPTASELASAHPSLRAKIAIKRALKKSCRDQNIILKKAERMKKDGHSA